MRMSVDSPRSRVFLRASTILFIALVAAIGATALLVRLHFLDQPMMMDEGAYAYLAQAWTEYGDVPYRDGSLNEPPGGVLLYRLAFALGGPTLPTVRWLGALYGALTSVVLALVARRIWGWAVGVLAGALHAAFAWSGPIEGMQVNLELFLALPVILAMDAGLRGIEERQTGWLFVSGALMGAAFLCKPPALTDALAVAVFASVQARRSAGRGGRGREGEGRGNWKIRQLGNWATGQLGSQPQPLEPNFLISQFPSATLGTSGGLAQRHRPYGTLGTSAGTLGTALLWYGVGWFLPLLGVSLVFARHQAFWDLWSSSLGINPLYLRLGLSPSGEAGVTRLIAAFEDLSRGLAPLWLGTLVWLVQCVSRRGKEGEGRGKQGTTGPWDHGTTGPRDHEVVGSQWSVVSGQWAEDLGTSLLGYWLLSAHLGAALGGLRLHRHYFVQTVAPLCLASALALHALLRGISRRRPRSQTRNGTGAGNGAASATISGFGFRVSDFGRGSGFRNSQSAIRNPQSDAASVPYLVTFTVLALLGLVLVFVKGHYKPEFQRVPGSHFVQAAAAAHYLRERLPEGAFLYVWGPDAEIYFLSRTRCASYFIFSFLPETLYRALGPPVTPDRTAPGGTVQRPFPTMVAPLWERYRRHYQAEDLRETRPAYFVIIPYPSALPLFPPIQQFLQENYVLEKVLPGGETSVAIYRRQDRQLGN